MYNIWQLSNIIAGSNAQHTCHVLTRCIKHLHAYYAPMLAAPPRVAIDRDRAIARGGTICAWAERSWPPILPEEGWWGREIFGLAKEESRVKGLGNGYF